MTREAGPEVALTFIDAPQSAYRLVGDYPSRSPRYAHELSLPGLLAVPRPGVAVRDFVAD